MVDGYAGKIGNCFEECLASRVSGYFLSFLIGDAAVKRLLFSGEKCLPIDCLLYTSDAADE